MTSRRPPVETFDEYDPFDSYDSSQSQNRPIPGSFGAAVAVPDESEARLAAAWFERRRHIRMSGSRRYAINEDRPVDLDAEIETVKHHDDEATVPTLGDENTQISNATSDRTPIISNARRTATATTTTRRYQVGGFPENEEYLVEGNHNIRGCRRNIAIFLILIVFSGFAIVGVSAFLGTRSKGSGIPTTPVIDFGNPLTGSPTFLRATAAPTLSPPTSLVEPSSTPSLQPTNTPSVAPSTQPSTPSPTNLPSSQPSYSWDGIDLEFSSSIAGQGGQFGYSVAIQDDTIVIAAPFQDDGTNERAGRVLVQGPGRLWQFTGRESGVALGSAVDLIDNYVAMSEPSRNGATGVVRVYDLKNDVEWQINGPVPGGYSGASLSFSQAPNGNPRLAVGSPYASDRANGLSWQGQVNVYELQGGDWVTVGRSLSGTASFDWYGSSVDLQGDYIAISAPQNRARGGYVNVYRFVENEWRKVGDDLANPLPRGSNDRFGHDVSLSVSTKLRIAVGAPWKEVSGYTDAGVVEVFEFDNIDWVSSGTLVRGFPRQLEEFGTSVLLKGDFLAVSAPGAGQGVVELYTHKNGSWRRKDSLVGSNLGDDFGVALGMTNARSQDMKLIVGAIQIPDGNGYVNVYEIN